MRKSLLSLCVAAIPMFALAQSEEHVHGTWCHSDHIFQQMLQDHPWIADIQAASEEEIRELIANSVEFRGGDMILRIPIVFHILHIRGQENIPNDRIYTQVAQLNADYRATAADISQVTAAFQPIIGDAMIEFVLPTVDPFGNCTNGINRIQTVQTFLGGAEAKLYQWPRNRYLNVWVTRSFPAPGLLGYALYPAGAEGFASILDGVMLRHSTVGISDPYLGRTLTHEIGHSLNLAHVWGDTNDPGLICGDDGVEDTPITKGSFECRLGANSIDCVEGVQENSQNHMDYSSCPRMFTEGQVERMRATLFTTTAQRNELWDEQNLIVTGVTEGHQATCPPDADFYAVVGTNLTNPTVPFNALSCTGTQVRFVDNSTRAQATGWQWTFQDGSPASSSEQNPTVTFGSPGWKSVTLTVSNDHGSTSKTDDFAVLISNSDDSWQVPYMESFEPNSSLLPYLAYNHDINHTVWDRVSGAGHTGSASARLNSGDRNPFNLLNPDNTNDIDEMVSPNLDLSPLGAAQLSFWYSYSTTASDVLDVTERLEVFSSTDCGRTWQLRTTVQNSGSSQDLVTNGNSSGPLVWRQRVVTLPASVLSDNVRFKFRFNSSAFSGDLYIDDIYVGGPVGMEEIGANNPVNLFPNPTNDHFTLQVHGLDRFPTTVMIQDLRGALVYSNVFAPAAGIGIDISAQAMGLSDGLYVLRASNEAGSGATKLMVGR